MVSFNHKSRLARNQSMVHDQTNLNFKEIMVVQYILVIDLLKFRYSFSYSFKQKSFELILFQLILLYLSRTFYIILNL